MQCPLNWRGTAAKWRGTVKKKFQALCAGIRAPPLSICFRRLCAVTSLMGPYLSALEIRSLYIKRYINSSVYYYFSTFTYVDSFECRTVAACEVDRRPSMRRTRWRPHQSTRYQSCTTSLHASRPARYTHVHRTDQASHNLSVYKHMFILHDYICQRHTTQATEQYEYWLKHATVMRLNLPRTCSLFGLPMLHFQPPNNY